MVTLITTPCHDRRHTFITMFSYQLIIINSNCYNQSLFVTRFPSTFFHCTFPFYSKVRCLVEQRRPWFCKWGLEKEKEKKIGLGCVEKWGKMKKEEENKKKQMKKEELQWYHGKIVGDKKEWMNELKKLLLLFLIIIKI